MSCRHMPLCTSEGGGPGVQDGGDQQGEGEAGGGEAMLRLQAWRRQRQGRAHGDGRPGKDHNQARLAPGAGLWGGFRGNHLSNTTCLTQVFFKSCK